MTITASAIQTMPAITAMRLPRREASCWAFLSCSSCFFFATASASAPLTAFVRPSVFGM